MTTDQIKAQPDAGHTICNVGQWSAPARAWVGRQYRAGNLEARPSTWPDARLEYRLPRDAAD